MVKKKSLKANLLYFGTLVAGVTAAYFVWLSWNKLTEIIGNSDLVWLITGGLVIVFLLTGMLSFSKIIKKFM